MPPAKRDEEQVMNDQPESDRFHRGLERLAELDGKQASDADPNVGAQMTGYLGDLGRSAIEFVFGEVYSRPGLTLRDRELATVAMLAVMGKETQLKTRMTSALKVGLTPEEITEVIIQSAAFAGFPTAINAMIVLKTLLAEQGQASS
jgi:4-carboxymuconolactone decarboxylase